MASTPAHIDSMMLRDHQHIVGMVHLYAQRRGIANAEALRQIVRRGLGLDPVGEKFAAGGSFRRRVGKELGAVSIKRVKRTRAAFPPDLQPMYLDLRAKVGSREARRLVREHQQLRHRP